MADTVGIRIERDSGADILTILRELYALALRDIDRTRERQRENPFDTCRECEGIMVNSRCTTAGCGQNPGAAAND